MRYILGFLGAVALIVLVFILIVRGFSGRGQGDAQIQLTDYAATKTVMRMTIEGPVNADQTHRSVTVDIGRDGNTINLIQGYQGTVLQTKNYANNENAYATFLRALQLQGYTQGNDDPKLEDSRGVCPTGKIYTFEVVTGAATVQEFWTTSCGGGTFKGKSDVIRQLFRAQIPDYSTVTKSTGLN